MNIEELETMRKKIANIYIWSIVLTIVGILIVIITRIYVILYLLIFLSPILAIAITYKKNKEFSKAFKNYFVLSALQQSFTDVHYEPERGISEYAIAATQMMNMGNRYTSNDYISAKYKDIHFEQADVHIEEEYQSTDSKGNTTTHYVTLFMGRWLIFDFNKTFKANVQVAENGFGNSKVKTFWGKKEELYKSIKMESEEFNKKFKIYAQNELDAFYILTPATMERISRLEKQNKGALLLCFINNKLHVGLYDNKDSFEHGSIFKPIDEEKTRNQISNDIQTITQFVDELNLDNTLFRREV